MAEIQRVPFFRPSIGPAEIDEVVGCLRSGWLTTGPLTQRFEQEFAAACGARHAVALNSCTAALHLAVEALGLKPGQGVLVPTMTFAATAEVVRYFGGLPILVDCQPDTLNMDLDDARRKLAAARRGELSRGVAVDVVGLIFVHVGGLMMDIAEIQCLAAAENLWLVEDAAHAFPAAWGPTSDAKWQRCGEQTADVTCFSFYANKTITTGEGGMAVTDRSDLADRMRMMSLHGLSRDAWGRYSGGGWDYRIVAPGFKYNITDIASALGIHQLARAEALRQTRQELADTYHEELGDIDELQLPVASPDRISAWHLFAIALHLDRLTVDRNTFLQRLNELGVGTSVHWRPLHLHPYYQQNLPEQSDGLPVATCEWTRRISLPLFPGMTQAELQWITHVVRDTCREYCRR